MLAASPRASCSPRHARFSAPPRSPRAAEKQQFDASAKQLSAASGGNSHESKTKRGGMSRAEQLRQWKLKRAAAALQESSSSSPSSRRAATSKRRRSNATAAIAQVSTRRERGGAGRQLRKIKVNVRRNQLAGAGTAGVTGPAIMIDLNGLKSASPDAAKFFSSSSSSSSPSMSKRSVASPGLRAMQKRIQNSAKKQKYRLRTGVSSKTMLLKQRLSAKKKKKKKTKISEAITSRENAMPRQQNAGQNKKRKGKHVASRYAQPVSRPVRGHIKDKVKAVSLSSSNKKRRLAKASAPFSLSTKNSTNSTTTNNNNSSSSASHVSCAIENDIPAQRQRERRNRVRIMAVGDIEVVQDHLKWGRHDAAAAMLQAMSPETEAVAKTLAKYWIQRAHIEEHGGNHARVQAIFKMAKERVQGKVQVTEIEAEASRYQQRTARWKKVASGQKDKEKQQLDGGDDEDTVLDCSMDGESGSMGDDTAKRLSFTHMNLSPPSEAFASSSSSSSLSMNDHCTIEEDNNDNDNDISFVFNGGNDSLDLSEDVQSENEDNNKVCSSSSSSSLAGRFSASSSRRHSLTASGRKKTIRVAKCGGLVLVDAPRLQSGEDSDVDSEDEAMMQSPPQPSSVVRMVAVRVASGSKKKELGSARALTPVRRAVRLAKNDENPLSTTEMLMQNGYSYMPNPSLCGTHFAPNMPSMPSDDEASASEEGPLESDSEFDTSSFEASSDEFPSSSSGSSGSIGSSSGSSSSSKNNKEQMVSPTDLASSGESTREPTPMLPRKFTGTSMPPPPSRAPASSNILGSAFVFNGVTPVRRSARIQELTPTPLRKEMESMLGF